MNALAIAGLSLLTVYFIGFLFVVIKFVWPKDPFWTRENQFKIGVIIGLCWPYLLYVFIKEKF